MSKKIDGLLPAEFRIDGNRHFIDRLVPEFLFPRARVVDVGGGKNPLIRVDRKRELSLMIVGIDVDGAQLRAAPDGCYDETVCSDITEYRGRGDGDLVICQALLEHVPNVSRALEAISTILKPGGRALIFVPSRNAAYARLNMLLPEPLKRRILYGIFPEMRMDHGFPAYYDRCTPAHIEQLAQAHGLVCEQRHLYFYSSYFSFCAPLHALWRIWLLLFRFLAGGAAAETFSFVFRRNPTGPSL